MCKITQDVIAGSIWHGRYVLTPTCCQHSKGADTYICSTGLPGRVGVCGIRENEQTDCCLTQCYAGKIQYGSG